jgi:Domain of unknown function (DUF4260)
MQFRRNKTMQLSTFTLPTLKLSCRSYGGLAVALAGATIATVFTRDASGWVALGFAMMPDIALIAGMSSGLEKGQLHPRAVPLYNVLHSFIGPIALGLLGVALGPSWLAAALAWGAHIAVDRAVGYGMRTSEGFQRA